MEEGDSAAHGYALPHTPGEEVEPGDEFEFEAGCTRVAAVLNEALVGDFREDGVEFGLDAGVGGWETAEFRETGETVVLAVDDGEPAWGVGEEVDACAEDGRGEHLEAEGESEGGFAGDEARGVGDPVGDCDAEGDGDGFEDQEGSAELGG